MINTTSAARTGVMRVPQPRDTMQSPQTTASRESRNRIEGFPQNSHREGSQYRITAQRWQTLPHLSPPTAGPRPGRLPESGAFTAACQARVPGQLLDRARPGREWDDRGRVPGDPVCVSQGRTEEEALVKLREAILGCLEVRAEEGLPLTVRTVEVEIAVA